MCSSALLDAIRGAGSKKLKSVDLAKLQQQKMQAAATTVVKTGGLVNEMVRSCNGHVTAK